jgi:signal transduction histidine kinase
MNAVPGSGTTGNAESAPRSPRYFRDSSVRLVLGALIASTLFLAAHSTLMHRRSTELTRETSRTMRPALRASQQFLVSLSLERQALLHSLAGDTTARADYRRYAGDRAAALATLGPLLERIGGQTLAHGQQLRRIDERWRGLARALEASAGAVDAAARTDADATYREMLIATVALEASLHERLDHAWQRVTATERLDWYYTLGQLLVAIAASLYIVRLVRDMRRLAREAEQRRLEAVQALEDRSRMIRGITHNVKNPLSVADAGAQLLELDMHGALTPSQRTAVARVRRGIGGALDVVRDLLDLGQSDAGGVHVDIAVTNVLELVRTAADDYRARAAADNIDFMLDVHGTLPYIATDARRVRQILDNLLSNAFKYTPDGGRVTLGAAIEPAQADKGWIALSVSDTGPGIEPNERERIFDEFYRSPDVHGLGEGTGVGLAISRRLARLLGGDIDVESDPGRITVFALHLPVDGPEADTQPPPNGKPVRTTANPA